MPLGLPLPLSHFSRYDSTTPTIWQLIARRAARTICAQTRTMLILSLSFLGTSYIYLILKSFCKWVRFWSFAWSIFVQQRSFLLKWEKTLTSTWICIKLALGVLVGILFWIKFSSDHERSKIFLQTFNQTVKGVEPNCERCLTKPWKTFN